MVDREIISSIRAGFKANSAARPDVLLVEEDSPSRALLAEVLEKRYGARVEQVATASDADPVALGRSIDILIFGNHDWEEGVLLYLELLNRQVSHCQLFLFIEASIELRPELRDLLQVIRKPGVERLLEALDKTVARQHGRAPDLFP